MTEHKCHRSLDLANGGAADGAGMREALFYTPGSLTPPLETQGLTLTSSLGRELGFPHPHVAGATGGR
jgi:hypothetical protein